MFKFSKKILIIIGLFVAIFVIANFVLADANDLLWDGTEAEVGNTIGLGNTDIRVMIANIIRIALGLLGIIAVLLIIYAGWLWMTAGGEAEKIDKAKKVLSGAIIGLVLIIMSFAIATFILNALYDSTNAGREPCSPEGAIENCGSCPYGIISIGERICGADGYWGSCQGLVCDGPSPEGFYTRSTVPNDGDTNVIRNVKIRFNYNVAVEPTTVDSTTFTVENSGGTEIGALEVSGKKITFTPDGDCPNNPCGAEKCLPENETITVTAVGGTGGILSVGDIELNCSPPASFCSITFETGELIDCDNPSVSLDFNQVCVNNSNEMYAYSSDDSGVYGIEYYVDNVLIFDIPAGNNPVINYDSDSPFNTRSEGLPSIWDGSGYILGDSVIIKAIVYDIDDHNSSNSKRATLRPEHCCNGVFDEAEGEEGVDCGGDCAGCEGAACGVSLTDDCDEEGINCHENDDKCSSRFCDCSGDETSCSAVGYDSGIDDCCLCQSKPIIDWISPQGGFCDNDYNIFCTEGTAEDKCGVGNTCNTATPNGKAGNLITMGGRYFGNTAGEVHFSADGGINWIEAKPPIVDGCDENWKDNQIIMVVPAGLEVGPGIIIKVTASSGYYDQTNDDLGAPIDFILNNIERPGLCELDPNHGVIDEVINYHGIKMSGGEAYFGNYSDNIKALNSSFTEQSGTANVPSIEIGKTSSFVENSNNIISNYIDFTKYPEPYLGPYINSFEPLEGAVGQYVTIYGGKFGDNQEGNSKVYFGDATTGVEASFDFPKDCADSVWTDNQVIIKVPEGLNNNSDYILTMKIISRDGSFTIDTTELTPDQFKFDKDLPLKPSLCKIEPIMGPNNNPISLWGEYFGEKITGLTRFHYNEDQSGTAIVFWGDDNDANKVETTVPQEAVSGPVRVVQKNSQGCNITDDCETALEKGWECINNKCQLVGNGMDFKIGLCTDEDDPNKACGGYCCLTGVKAGRCASDAESEGGNGDSAVNIDDCFVAIEASVYEWDFSTEDHSDLIPCDEDINTPQCDPDDNICKTKKGEEWYCEPLSCVCKEGDPESYDSCQAKSLITGTCGPYYCPNSPGQCSPEKNPAPLTANNCDDTYCEQQCAGCEYDPVLKKCVLNKTCALSSTKVINKDGQDYTFNKYCAEYENKYYWHYKGNDNCQIIGDNWINIGNQICVNIDPGNQCSLCSDEKLSCIDDKDGDDEGICGINNPVCPSGYECKNGACIKEVNPYCDCCCDINENTTSPVGNPSCCSPLICGVDCGEGTSSDQTKDYGLCMNCNINNDQTLSDDACNCEGAIGKFCDMTAAGNKGVCKDCAVLGSDSHECSSHSSVCCFDGNNGKNLCSGLDIVAGQANFDDGSGTKYCAYYDCKISPEYGCNTTELISGIYKSKDTCDEKCPTSEEELPGNSCYNENKETCSLTCQEPYYCFGGDGCFDNIPVTDPYTSAGGCQAGDESCLCCCDTTADPDPCLGVGSANLNCQEAKPCENGNRGLCCGCEVDSECGNINTVGCSSDTCCRPRPIVESTVPTTSPVSDKVCQNAQISATFNTKMNIGSFSGNIIVIGDYGDQVCPKGTEYLAMNGKNLEKKNILVKLYYRIIRLWGRITGQKALAEANKNYCAIIGKVGNEQLNNKTKITFDPLHLMSGNKDYYVIIKGDSNLEDGIKEGVLSNWDVSMDGLNEEIFNGIIYKNSYIWHFKTYSDQEHSRNCQISSVKIDPGSYLFQTAENNLNDENDTDPSNSSFDTVRDSDKVFTAKALSANGQVLSSTDGYNWIWNWTIDNSNVVDMVGSPPFTNNNNQQLIRAQTGIVDAKTNVNVIADIAEGGSKTGSAVVYVFICDNPWPTVKANGTWKPWRDEEQGMPNSGTGNDCIDGKCKNTNYELYYCRDAGGVGTADDLPAILSDDTLIRGAKLVCSDPNGNCSKLKWGDKCGNKQGICQYESLKEAYYFREDLPDTSSADDYLKVKSILAEGSRVELAWHKLKKCRGGLYDGEDCTFSGSVFCLRGGVSVCDDDKNISGYKIYYGTKSKKYNTYIDVGNIDQYTVGDLICSNNTICPANAKVGDLCNNKTGYCKNNSLTNNKTYYFALTSYTAEQAESEYSNEVFATPKDISAGADLKPNIIDILPGDKKVEVVWEDKSNGEAKSFRIFYKGGVAANDCDNSTNFGASIAVPYALIGTSTVSGLTNGIEYCLGMIGYDQSANESDIVYKSIIPFAPVTGLEEGDSYVAVDDSSYRWTFSWQDHNGNGKIDCDAENYQEFIYPGPPGSGEDNHELWLQEYRNDSPISFFNFTKYYNPDGSMPCDPETGPTYCSWSVYGEDFHVQGGLFIAENGEIPNSNYFGEYDINISGCKASGKPVPPEDGDGAVILEWEKADEANNYKIFYKEASGDYDNIIEVGNTNKYYIINLNAETDYYFKILSLRDGMANGTYSNELRVTAATPYIPSEEDKTPIRLWDGKDGHDVTCFGVLEDCLTALSAPEDIDISNLPASFNPTMGYTYDYDGDNKYNLLLWQGTEAYVCKEGKNCAPYSFQDFGLPSGFVPDLVYTHRIGDREKDCIEMWDNSSCYYCCETGCDSGLEVVNLDTIGLPADFDPNGVKYNEKVEPDKDELIIYGNTGDYEWDIDHNIFSELK